MTDDLQVYADWCNDAYCLEARKHESGVMWCNDNFNLNAGSRVVEIGGYTGDWTAYITNKYDSFIDVYEPIISCCNEMASRFQGKPKVKVFNSAVDAFDGQAYLDVRGEGSRLRLSEDVPLVPVKVRSISSVVRDHWDLNLLALNCEGSEYNILDSLLESNNITRVRTLLIQFHTHYPEAANRRMDILNRLNVTHSESLCFPFTWEIWTRR